MIRAILSSAALSATLLAAGAAFASPTCTDAAKNTWLTEEAMKEKITQMGYKDIRTFKTTSGNCYEIYGHDKNGKRVEVYFHPVTGAVVSSK